QQSMEVFPQTGCIGDRGLKGALRAGTARRAGISVAEAGGDAVECSRRRTREISMHDEIESGPARIMARPGDVDSARRAEMVDREQETGARRQTDVDDLTTHPPKHLADAR